MAPPSVTLEIWRILHALGKVKYLAAFFHDELQTWALRSKIRLSNDGATEQLRLAMNNWKYFVWYKMIDVKYLPNSNVIGIQ